MATAAIVIELEHFEFPRQIHGIPEENTIEVLTPNRPDQPFHEGMRNGGVRNGLDLIDLEHAQVGKPTVKAKQRIMVGTEPFRFALAGSGAIEHPANRDAINRCGRDTETNDAARE